MTTTTEDQNQRTGSPRRAQAAAARVSVRNTTSDRMLGSELTIASTRFDRAIGLLSRKRFDAGEVLLIVPSRGVHTFGMRFAIDVVSLDRQGRVVDAIENLKPWRIRLPRPGTVGVLELPGGTIASSATRLGDEIAFESGPEGE